MDNESINKFVDEWFSETDKSDVKPISSIQSSRRLTEKEIDDAFDEINKFLEKALETAHNKGLCR